MREQCKPILHIALVVNDMKCNHGHHLIWTPKPR